MGRYLETPFGKSQRVRAARATISAGFARVTNRGCHRRIAPDGDRREPWWKGRERTRGRIFLPFCGGAPPVQTDEGKGICGNGTLEPFVNATQCDEEKRVTGLGGFVSVGPLKFNWEYGRTNVRGPNVCKTMSSVASGISARFQPRASRRLNCSRLRVSLTGFSGCLSWGRGCRMCASCGCVRSSRDGCRCWRGYRGWCAKTVIAGLD